MKLLLVVAFLAVCLATSEAKRCRSQEECGEDECCIAKGISGFRKGECKKLAQKDESCSEEGETVGFLDKQYVFHCPCAAGLSCEPSEVKDLPFVGTLKIDERCVPDTSVTTPAEPEPETEEPETEEPETEEPEPETEEPEPEPETEEPEQPAE